MKLKKTALFLSTYSVFKHIILESATVLEPRSFRRIIVRYENAVVGSFILQVTEKKERRVNIFFKHKNKNIKI